MKVSGKIIYDDKQQLMSVISEARKNGNKIVLCGGHFNVIHPGHLRFIEFAKKQGDYLVIAIQGNTRIEQRVNDKFFNQEQRAMGAASLEYVDKVFVFNNTDLLDVLQTVQPNIYVKGEEFSRKMDEIKDEIDIIEKHGGKVVFSSGDSSNA
ncbi:MAG: adenylyltransferase/cytidyltransferase family protein, partial [Pseudomonadota bacterium]